MNKRHISRPDLKYNPKNGIKLLELLDLACRSIEKRQPKRQTISKFKKLKYSNKLNKNIINAKLSEAFTLKQVHPFIYSR